MKKKAAPMPQPFVESFLNEVINLLRERRAGEVRANEAWVSGDRTRKPGSPDNC